jgi:hypothetical protein
MPKGQFVRKGRPVRTVSFEALESRTHFDLVPMSVKDVPANLIATDSTRDKVKVELQNTGKEKISGSYTLTLFASATSALTISGSDTQITSVDETLKSLSTGASRSISVSLGTFPQVANGQYYILAQITGSLALPGHEVAASGNRVAITNPFIDLTDTVALKTDSVKPGGTASFSVTVTNGGNMTASGPLAITIDQSVNSNGSDPTVLTTENVTIDLAAGKSKTFTFSQPLNIDTTAGDYFIAAVVDPENTFSESNSANNTGVSHKPLTVLDLYPDMVGTLTGTFKTRSGPDHGAKGTVTVDVSSESQSTGAMSGTITDSAGDNATFAGTMSTSGVLSAVTTDVVGGGTGSITGTFSNGKFTGTFTASSGDVNNISVKLG